VSRYPIPSEALDDRLAWTGMTGTGKTHDAGTAVERVMAAKGRVIPFDPLGVWWGLRLAADGKGASRFRIVIFGGPHGDVAITPTSGRLIGEALAAMPESAIVDLSEFESEAQQRIFMRDALTALYGKATGEPVHLVFDEADMWAPQNIRDKEGDAAKLHHRMQTVVRRGRVKGLISWLITQRPAEISKSVLSQVDGIVAHQLVVPQDVNPLMEWVTTRADPSTAATIREGLPAFERGQAVVYIPRRRILEIAQFPKKATFDSSRTPERGEKKNRPQIELKPLDLEALKKRLEKVEAEAKANDPGKLKSDIAKLQTEKAAIERQVAAAAKNAADPKDVATAKGQGQQLGYEQGYAAGEKAGLAKGWERGCAEGLRSGVHAGWMLGVEAMKREFGTFRAGPEERDQEAVARTLLKAAPRRPKDIPAMPAAAGATAEQWREARSEVLSRAPKRPPPVQPAAPPTRPLPAEAPSGTLPGPLQKILDAIAWWNALGVAAPRSVQAAFVAGYRQSGTWDRYCSELRSRGLLEPRRDGRMSLTAEGLAQAAAPEAVPSIPELHRRVFEQLDGPLVRILEQAIAAYPEDLPSNELCARAGYQPSGTFDRYMSSLRSLGLIESPTRGRSAASAWLFEGPGL
jgi:uncharacterized protein